MEARPNYPVTTAIAASGVGPSNFVARFGWKSALLAFSGNAYLNEIGITNRISFSETHFLYSCRFRRPAIDTFILGLVSICLCLPI
jgi:hypothetical protein